MFQRDRTSKCVTEIAELSAPKSARNQKDSFEQSTGSPEIVGPTPQACRSRFKVAVRALVFFSSLFALYLFGGCALGASDVRPSPRKLRDRVKAKLDAGDDWLSKYQRLDRGHHRSGGSHG
jgi:hypothetical protein